ncbi:MAG: DNA repair protein RadC [Chloroflexi bacterium]|nr:DNA repair protein RadC [Chloroflexota bacterium]
MGQFRPPLKKTIESLRSQASHAGMASLSNVELLALILHNGNAGEDVFALADYVLQHFSDLEGVAQASLDELTQISGIGQGLATRLQAALMLGQRVSLFQAEDHPIIRRPSDAVRLIERHLIALPQEQLIVVLMDTQNRVMNLETVYIGSLNTTVVRVAEIFRPAILQNSAGLILAHNHPSGDATPSNDDVQLTQDAVAAGKLLDIAVLDHLVIGRGEWVSMRERGLGFE